MEPVAPSSNRASGFPAHGSPNAIHRVGFGGVMFYSKLRGAASATGHNARGAGRWCSEAHTRGFTFVAADWFRHPVVLSGGTSRHSSVTGPFDRGSSNSVEQTFTAVVDVFIGALLKNADGETANPR